MKRLLLPLLAALALPTAVNAFPFGKNLQFKNDIGTKYLIKGDAVYSNYLSSKDLVSPINKYEKDRLATTSVLFNNKLDEKREIGGYIRPYAEGGVLAKNEHASERLNYWRERMDEIDKDMDEIISIKKKISKRNKENLELLKTSENIKIHAVNLKFQPILIDLNNNQSVKQEITISCLNPELSKEIRQLWIDYYALKGAEGERQLAICKKYAKFK